MIAILGAQRDIVLLASAVRTAGLRPAHLMLLSLLPFTNNPNSKTPARGQRYITQRSQYVPRFAHAKPHSTCGTGRNACATHIKGHENENHHRIRRNRTRRHPHPRRPSSRPTHRHPHLDQLRRTPQSNIYRAAGQCPTSAPTGFTKLNSTPVTTGTFADAAPLIGLSCYYVTATSNGLESVPSPLVQVSLPPAPPTAPQATAK